MSRSGYDYDLEPLILGRWRAQVASAIRGKRGQAFLKELVTALDAMPEKRLIVESLLTGNGEVCALGAVFQARGISVGDVDSDDPEFVGDALGIAKQLAAEIEFENDSRQWCENDEQRWRRMRQWAQGLIRE